MAMKKPHAERAAKYWRYGIESFSGFFFWLVRLFDAHVRNGKSHNVFPSFGLSALRTLKIAAIALYTGRKSAQQTAQAAREVNATSSF